MRNQRDEKSRAKLNENVSCEKRETNQLVKNHMKKSRENFMFTVRRVTSTSSTTKRIHFRFQHAVSILRNILPWQKKNNIKGNCNWKIGKHCNGNQTWPLYIGRNVKENQVTVSEYIRQTPCDVEIFHSKLEGCNLLNDTKTKPIRQGIQLGSTKHREYIHHRPKIPRRTSIASRKS